MSLSLKAELETWAAALEAYDGQDFDKALDLFSCIADSSKILTNMGLIYATVGEHETAVEHFVAATNLDSYLAIAHFQCGVSNFLLQRYDSALLNFEDAHLYLRGNEAINYDQLGLKFKLFSAEIMFNKGLAQLNLGYAQEGMADMQEASRLKVTSEHGVIDEAIRDRGEGYTVFSIPVGVLYRPSENKLKNSKSKDYLGKAKLVAASDASDAFTEFTGVVKLQQASADKGDENKQEGESSTLSRSATVPTPRTDAVVAILERSKTALQLAAAARPDAATILASRRTQSVSNPANVPPPPFASDLSRGNTALRRSRSTRLTRSTTANVGVMPLRARTPQGTRAGGSGTDVDVSRVDVEAATVTASPLMTLRSPPSLRRLNVQGAPLVVQPSQALQAAQYANIVEGVKPLVLSTVSPQTQGDGHLTQFYNTYMDVYSEEQTPRSVASRPSTSQAQSSASSSRRQSPAKQLQPLPREQPPPSGWMQSASGPTRTPSDPSTNSGRSRASSRATNVEPTMNVGAGTNTAGRRKQMRRPGTTTRRAMAYDNEDGDDGFVAGEYEEIEMANIRVKLHYQGDVRGMAIRPTISFKEFVERVTTKFETSLTGLGMKFTDEDGCKISMRDESDFDLAIETARENAKGRSDGKIEVWCVDV